MSTQSATQLKKSLLWHPCQGLWNNELLQKIKEFSPKFRLYGLIVKSIIILDTSILFLRAIAKRLSCVGFTKIFAVASVPAELPVFYFDLGTHKEGTELRWMVEEILPRLCKNFTAYGFEANQKSFELASSHFVGKTNVKIIHKALCHEVPDNSKIRLYKDSHEGLEDSLYRQTNTYEEVDAIRFSDWLRENNIIFERKICLLRMNIEGAEDEVIADLIEQNLAEHIDGYYGMWDDVLKIDNQRGFNFLSNLRKHRIYPFTFNGRDFLKPSRLKCIEYDINTSLMAAMQSKF